MTQVQNRPTWRYQCEHFTECRDRLMEVHDWSRAKATLATRLYLGIDTREQLCSLIPPEFIGFSEGDDIPAYPLRKGDVHEICMVR